MIGSRGARQAGPDDEHVTGRWQLGARLIAGQRMLTAKPKRLVVHRQANGVHGRQSRHRQQILKQRARRWREVTLTIDPQQLACDTLAESLWRTRWPVSEQPFGEGLHRACGQPPRLPNFTTDAKLLSGHTWAFLRTRRRSERKRARSYASDAWHTSQLGPCGRPILPAHALAKARDVRGMMRAMPRVEREHRVERERRVPVRMIQLALVIARRHRSQQSHPPLMK